MTRLAWSWLQISGLPVVVAVSFATAWYGWSSRTGITGLPGVRTNLEVDVVLPCVVALGSTAGLVEDWSWIMSFSPRPVWALPTVRFAGTQVAAVLPWLVTFTDPSSKRVVPLVVAAVAIAACAVSVLGSFGWIPLVLLAYVFLQWESQHPIWLFHSHTDQATTLACIGYVVYVTAAVRKASPRRRRFGLA